MEAPVVASHAEPVVLLVPCENRVASPPVPRYASGRCSTCSCVGPSGGRIDTSLGLVANCPTNDGLPATTGNQHLGPVQAPFSTVLPLGPSAFACDLLWHPVLSVLFQHHSCLPFPYGFAAAVVGPGAGRYWIPPVLDGGSQGS